MNENNKEMAMHSYPSSSTMPSSLYEWVLSLAYKRYATAALFALSFAESSVFPIAPDVLQIALTLSRRERAWLYAAISTVGSVLGGILGYLLGAIAWSVVSEFFFHNVFSVAAFDRVSSLYHTWDFWAVFIAAFTPIPYKVFTLAAGVFQISLPLFLMASLIGRGARFFIVATLLWAFGASIKECIEKYFNVLTILFVSLLFGGMWLLSYL